MQVEKKSYEDILIHYSGYKALDGVKSLNIIFTKTNWYVEDNSGSKYQTLRYYATFNFWKIQNLFESY